MTSTSQGSTWALGKLAFRAEPLGPPGGQWVAAKEREAGFAVTQKSLPLPWLSGLSNEGHLLPVSEPSSRQPGTSPLPQQAPAAPPPALPLTLHPRRTELLNFTSPGTRRSALSLWSLRTHGSLSLESSLSASHLFFTGRHSLLPILRCRPFLAACPEYQLVGAPPLCSRGPWTARPILSQGDRCP